MSVKCEEPLNELTVQVWLLYHHQNFNYWTLFVSGTELRTDGWTERRMDKLSLELGKNNKTYFVIHILVSFNIFKCACIFIHTVLLEIHVWFHVLFYSNLSFFLHCFEFFLKESNWENLRSKLGKKDTIFKYFALGMGAEYRPQIRQIESPDAHDTYVYLCPLWKRRGILRCTCRSVGMSVGRSVCR